MNSVSIDRTALIAWSPKYQETSVIACGTFAGAFDASFNTESRLELFDLSSNKPIQLASINVPSRFNRIIWTSIEANFKDLIIGSFDDGRLEVWDTQMLLNAEPNAMIEIPILHSGPVKGLARSCFQPNLIASGATNGEIALWNLDNLDKASLLSVKKSENFRNVTDLAWNPRVPHIIATSSNSGVISIIDLRSKKEVTSISIPNFSPISSIAWNPENPTYIIGASEDDLNPFIYSWDLRSNNYPESIFKGHSKGVLCLSWCQQDNEMCLSSGKDSKTICWNPKTNEIVKELYYKEKEVFDVQWCDKNPNLFCTSSFNGGIQINSINTIFHGNNSIEKNTNQVKAPKWFNRPIGAAFGGNNVCAIFRNDSHHINLLKPEINFINEIYNNLVDFESKINHISIESVCEHELKKETILKNNYIWKLLKSLSSPDMHTEILKLIEIQDDKFLSNHVLDSNISDASELLLTDLDLNSDITDIKSVDKIITDKIINSDFEGAVLICIEKKRFSDALIIANCGENSLREFTEDLILEKSGSIYLSIAKSINRQDLNNFVLQTPLSEWKNILAVICNHSSAISIENLLRKLAERLIQEKLDSCAIYVFIILGDFEKFLDIAFQNQIRLSIKCENDVDFYKNLIFAYKVIRIIEAHSPNYILSFTHTSMKIFVFEIITKLQYLLFSFGLDLSNITKLNYISNIYSPHLQAKNSIIDEFIACNSQEVLSNSSDFEHNNNHTENLIVSESTPKIPIPTQNILHQKVSTNLNNTALNSSWESSLNIKYNDIPTINPNLSKLSPLLLSQVSDLSVEIVNQALHKLTLKILPNTMETNVRIINECFKKLSAESICSKDYSNLSKPCIIALFNEIITEKFEQAAVLASNILATYFSETRDWILSLKRLIEFAKIK